MDCSRIQSSRVYPHSTTTSSRGGARAEITRLPPGDPPTPANKVSVSAPPITRRARRIARDSKAAAESAEVAEVRKIAEGDDNLPYKHFKLSQRLVYDQCTTQPKHEIPPKARSQRSPAAALAAHTLLHVQYASGTREVAPGQACAPSSSRRRSRAAQRRIRHASDVPKIQPYAITYCPPPPPRTSKAPSKQLLMAPSRSISQLSVGALGAIAALQKNVAALFKCRAARSTAPCREYRTWQI
ncbi:hypothetical protein FB45DRAFT_1010431 [Roridomyces roridus]|uniref:Uncharacterized protein n=1 Tax=Roridomyces roridus TaxID=1738132 RepID=A0AAD7B3Z5_9AGAR|nr:hypothetical protein FB45DRAFT_1010431 [Roridomyces roridus]